MIQQQQLGILAFGHAAEAILDNFQYSALFADVTCISFNRNVVSYDFLKHLRFDMLVFIVDCNDARAVSLAEELQLTGSIDNSYVLHCLLNAAGNALPCIVPDGHTNGAADYIANFIVSLVKGMTRAVSLNVDIAHIRRIRGRINYFESVDDLMAIHKEQPCSLVVLISNIAGNDENIEFRNISDVIASSLGFNVKTMVTTIDDQHNEGPWTCFFSVESYQQDKGSQKLNFSLTEEQSSLLFAEGEAVCFIHPTLTRNGFTYRPEDGFTVRSASHWQILLAYLEALEDNEANRKLKSLMVGYSREVLSVNNTLELPAKLADIVFPLDRRSDIKVVVEGRRVLIKA